MKANRGIYDSARWRALRRETLLVEPFCRMCFELGLGAVLATDVDHRVRIEAGGAAWDPTNLQSLCHAHHSKKTRSETTGVPMRSEAPHVKGARADGLPIDPRHWWNTE